MNRYEAMFLINSGLDQKATDTVFGQIKDVIDKNKGDVVSSRTWAERRKMTFPIKKHQEATYYLVNFNLAPNLIDKMKQVYALNENILRVMITRME